MPWIGLVGRSWMGDQATISAHLKASRPKALAALVSWCRDMDLAEDALQTAGLRASQTWQENGIPRDPLAWLIHVARNAARDELRKSVRRAESQVEDIGDLPDSKSTATDAVFDQRRFGDDGLRLLFLCCHPSLSETDQMILCLRYVLGLSINDLARAFVVTPDSLQRRVTRARQRAKKYVSPESSDIAPAARVAQLGQVRAALYLMFNKGYSASHGESHVQPILARESLRLARLLISLFPYEPESLGLLALFLGQSARLAARQGPDGELIALADQDRNLWDRRMIQEADVLVQKALRRGAPGPYQVQAAIAAVHNATDLAVNTDWNEIHRLYQLLERLSPSPVVTLNRIVAVSQLYGASAALDQLQPLAEPLQRYLPFHAVYAGLSEETGRAQDALSAYRSAMSCHPSSEESRFLSAQILRLEKSCEERSE